MDVRRFVFAAAFVMPLTSAAFAAPFVHGAPQPLSAEIAKSRAAVVAAAVNPGDQSAGWNIERVLHDATGRVAIGQTIHPEPLTTGDARRILVISNSDRTVSSWSVSKAAEAYLESLPQATAAPEERLRFALSHLRSKDPLIAGDAFAMLSRLSVADFLKHRETLPAEVLRDLVNAQETPPHRLGLYGYLLGLCGDPRDASWLRRRLLREEELSCGADGLAAGYLLLTQEEGLTDLESTLLVAGQGSPMLVAAFFETLLFLDEAHPTLLSRERLQQAGTCGLSREDAADLAIGYLAQGRYWQTLPAVTALLDSDDANIDRRRAVQVASVRFLLECRRDTDTALTVRAKAEELLGRIAEFDSDLLRRASHLAGELPAQR